MICAWRGEGDEGRMGFREYGVSAELVGEELKDAACYWAV